MTVVLWLVRSARPPHPARQSDILTLKASSLGFTAHRAEEVPLVLTTLRVLIRLGSKFAVVCGASI
jgi:hypothetical protein